MCGQNKKNERDNLFTFTDRNSRETLEHVVRPRQRERDRERERKGNTKNNKKQSDRVFDITLKKRRSRIRNQHRLLFNPKNPRKKKKEKDGLRA